MYSQAKSLADRWSLLIIPRHELFRRIRDSFMQAFSIVVLELMAGIGSTNLTLAGSLATTTQRSFLRSSVTCLSLTWFGGRIIIGFIKSFDYGLENKFVKIN